jgi:condensin complex subunit 1
MDNVNFDINEALKLYMSDPATIPTEQADSALFDCENDPESLTNGVINPVLNPIIDAVAENPDAITRSAHFDSLQFLLKCAPISLSPSESATASTSASASASISASPSSRCELARKKSTRLVTETDTPSILPTPEQTPDPEPDPDPGPGPEHIRVPLAEVHVQGHVSKLFQLSRYTPYLPTHALSKVFDLITSGLSTEADIIHTDLESDEQDLLSHHKHLLEIYGFLLQWTISCVETKAAEKSSSAPAVRGRKPKGKKAAADKDANWDSAAQLQIALDTMCKVLRLKLGKIFLTTSERDTFIGLITRPVYLILESEQRIKNTTIRMHAFKVLCIAVKHHGHGYGEWLSLCGSDGEGGHEVS